jgi:AraC family ethanolamine operon transcriptional activator
MSAQFNSPDIQRWHSEDIDEQSALLHGWEQEYRQLGCGKFVGTVSTVQGPRMTIAGERTNQSLHQYIVPPQDSLVFGLVLNRDDALQVNRRKVDTHTLIVLDGGKEHEFRTDGCTELLGVSLEKTLFEDQGGHEDVIGRALVQGAVPLAPGAAGILHQLWLTMSRILQASDAWPDSLPLPLLANTALNNIVLALSLSAGDGMPILPRAAERQARVVKQAIRYMRANLERHFSILDVCAAAHVSQRTLQYHFESCLGMSPQQYLKAMRLNAARRMLRGLGTQSQCHGHQTSIADVAAQCGYEHPSRFAGDYRRQFGTLPSETLRTGAQLAAQGA